MNATAIETGTKLRMAREAASMTKAQLAALVAKVEGVDKLDAAIFSKYEQGIRKPSPQREAIIMSVCTGEQQPPAAALVDGKYTTKPPKKIRTAAAKQTKAAAQAGAEAQGKPKPKRTIASPKRQDAQEAPQVAGTDKDKGETANASPADASEAEQASTEQPATCPPTPQQLENLEAKAAKRAKPQQPDANGDAKAAKAQDRISKAKAAIKTAEELEAEATYLEDKALKLTDSQAEVAARLGLNVDKSGMERLLSDGWIVSIGMSREAGKISLDPEDFGIEEGDGDEAGPMREFLSQHVKGHKILLPKDFHDRCQSIDVQGRAIPKKYGFKTTWGDYVHLSKMDDLIKDFKELRERWAALGAKFTSDAPALVDDQPVPGPDGKPLTYYQYIVKQAEDAYTSQAKAIWRINNAVREAFLDEAEYIRRVLDRTVAKLPSAQALADSFVKTKDGRPAVRIKVIAIPQPAKEEAGASEDKARAIQFFRQEIGTEIRDTATNLMLDIQKDIRSRVYDVFAAVADNIKAKKQLRSVDIISLNNLIDRISEATRGVVELEDVDQMFNKLRAMLPKPDDERDARRKFALDVSAALEQMTQATAEVLEGMGAVPAKIRARRDDLAPLTVEDVKPKTRRRAKLDASNDADTLPIPVPVARGKRDI